MTAVRISGTQTDLYLYILTLRDVVRLADAATISPDIIQTTDTCQGRIQD